MQPLRDLNDNRTEFVYLVDMCKKVLANPSLYPKKYSNTALPFPPILLCASSEIQIILFLSDNLSKSFLNQYIRS